MQNLSHSRVQWGLCYDMFCHKHSLACALKKTDGLMYVLCEKCVGWRDNDSNDKAVSRREDRAGGCVDCGKPHVNIQCLACGAGICYKKQLACSQRHPYCQDCVVTEVKYVFCRDVKNKLHHLSVCKWCLQREYKATEGTCRRCLESHKDSLCNKCGVTICMHTSNECGMGHFYCQECSGTSIVTLTKQYSRNAETVTYEICQLCLK